MLEILACNPHLIPNLPAAIVSVFVHWADQSSQAQTLVAVEHWHSLALDKQTIIIIMVFYSKTPEEEYVQYLLEN